MTTMHVHKPGPKLPDVARDSAAPDPGRLNWVGMEHIVLPLTIEDALLGPQRTSATFNCYVDLCDPQTRGIHMSRMYVLLTELSRDATLDYPAMEELTAAMIRTQNGISRAAKIGVTFDLFVKKKSLRSDNFGWLNYPLGIWMLNNNGAIMCQLDFRIIYSSTCPCSAALSRQLISKKFAEHFNQEGTLTAAAGKQWLQEEEKAIATPHSQRSIAQISLLIEPCRAFPLWELIQQAESTLKTSVQSVVKREDEQQFAKLNGENLMFCEDATRALQQAFLNYVGPGLSISVRHLESLHPHDAVARFKSGRLVDEE